MTKMMTMLLQTTTTISEGGLLLPHLEAIPTLPHQQHLQEQQCGSVSVRVDVLVKLKE